MGYYLVEGGGRIAGEFTVHGSKNAVLPILAATILAQDEVVLENCPQIADVQTSLEILTALGCQVVQEGQSIVIDSRTLEHTQIQEDMVCKMRSSILYLGALLGRCKQATLGHPGGCEIGRRPIDMHLRAFEKMGVQGKFNIRCNCLSAGPVKTLAAKGIGGFDKMLKFNALKAPLNRTPSLEDVGKAGLYLASDLSSGVTGQVQFVDCGASSVFASIDEMECISQNA